MKIYILNGPNLNLLGAREPEVYGTETLEDIIKYTEQSLEDDSGLQLEWFQSNIEGELVEKIHEALNKKIDAIIINPAAYSHTSVAIHDALKCLKCPVVEVHLSNTANRDSFRQTMLTAKASTIIMEGLGRDAYLMAIKALTLK